MPSIKTLKTRLTSLRSIHQIVQAVHKTAASKLQHARARLPAAREMAAEAERLVGVARQSVGAAEHPLVRHRAVRQTGCVVIASEKGLCGEYNATICKSAYSYMREQKNEKIIAVGTSAFDFFLRQNMRIYEKAITVTEKTLYEDAVQIADLVLQMYLTREIDEVYVAYMRFGSTLVHEPRILKILPVYQRTEHSLWYDLVEFEQDADTFLTAAAHIYLSAIIYSALTEALACEQAARMTSMDAASESAAELIEKLNLVYNRTRQSLITQEISEIVAAVSVLQA